MDLQQLIEKALHDEVFFKRLQTDPAKALQSAGVKATPNQLPSLKQLNYKSCWMSQRRSAAPQPILLKIPGEGMNYDY